MCDTVENATTGKEESIEQITLERKEGENGEGSEHKFIRFCVIRFIIKYSNEECA